MRSDYALYAIAIIFFIITLMAVFVQLELKELWIITTTVLGFLFIGLGYTQRPKSQAVPPPPAPTPPPMSTLTSTPEQTPATETVQEEKKEIAIEAAPAPVPQTPELMKVKGIGAKRAEQLKAIGINTIGDLAKASAEDLASKLQISPKITSRWISEAKKLTEQS